MVQSPWRLSIPLILPGLVTLALVFGGTFVFRDFTKFSGELFLAALALNFAIAVLGLMLKPRQSLTVFAFLIICGATVLVGMILGGLAMILLSTLLPKAKNDSMTIIALVVFGFGGSLACVGSMFFVSRRLAVTGNFARSIVPAMVYFAGFLFLLVAPSEKKMMGEAITASMEALTDVSPFGVLVRTPAAWLSSLLFVYLAAFLSLRTLPGFVLLSMIPLSVCVMLVAFNVNSVMISVAFLILSWVAVFIGFRMIKN